MNYKPFLSVAITALMGITGYSQEGNNHQVTIEDSNDPNLMRKLMDHPDYGKNRQRYLELSREIDEEFSKQSSFYINNIEKPGLKRDEKGWYSKENLTLFIEKAEAFKRTLQDNIELKDMCSEYTTLKQKVRPMDQNQCEFLMTKEISMINNRIERAKKLMNDPGVTKS